MKLSTVMTIEGDITGQSGLPPEEAWLINPKRDKFETPVDDRGFIDVPTLIQAVKDSIDPEYVWPKNLSVHHLYWKEDWYSSRFIGMDGQKFRNLSPHKALVPRVFENWLHAVTIPPDVPDPFMMQQRITAWTQARSLFDSARQVIRWERMARRRALLIEHNPDVLPPEFEGEDLIGREIIARILGKHFTGFAMNIDRFLNLPEEHRPLEQVSHSPHEVANVLGKLVVPQTLKLTSAVAA